MYLLGVFIITVLICILTFFIQYSLSGYKKSGGYSFKEIFWGRLIKSNKNIGAEGEYYTYLELLKFKCLGAKLLTNLYIFNEDNESTEIDIVMIHKTGIYIFESKNMSGWIYGSGSDKYWTQVLGNYRHKFYNPIFQNNKHVKYISDLYDGKYRNNIYSFIVFSDRCRLKKVKYSGDVRIFRRCNLVYNVKKRILNSEVVFTKNDIDSIYNELKQYTNVTSDIKKQHILNIDNKLTLEKSYLKKIDLNVGKLEYDMYQDIPREEIGSSNIINGKTYEEFREIIKYYIKSENEVDSKLNTCTTRYIYYVHDRPVGEICIRTTLNEYWENKGSQIFYKVRLSERNKGYGTKMLALALDECRKFGFKKVCLNCNNNNIASKKIIQKNGGKFLYNYGVSSRYQIDL